MTSTDLLEFRKILKRKKPRFLRKDTFKKSRLGKRRKKKQKWRRPRGRHSKIREKRTGHMIQPSIGWSSPRSVRGLVQGSKPKLIFNVQDLLSLKENEIGILGKVGKKKKMEILKEAEAKKIRLANVTKKILEKLKKEEKKIQAKKSEKKEKPVEQKEPKTEKPIENNAPKGEEIKK